MMRFDAQISRASEAQGKAPRPFGWEIYDERDERVPVDRSAETYDTESAALAAGERALERLRRQLGEQ